MASEYNKVNVYTINRNVSINTGYINLSLKGIEDSCLMGSPIQACPSDNPKCGDKTSTYYNVFDRNLNLMFTTDEDGFKYIISDAPIGVNSYFINRGVSSLKTKLLLSSTDTVVKAPIVKSVFACPSEDPKCGVKTNTYYQFYNSLNKLLFITDQKGYDVIDNL